MSKPLPWFRAYTEMMDDEKLRLLAFEDRWHFVAILCMKGAGILDEAGPLLMRKAAVKMGLAVRELDEVARRLSEVGLIDKDTLQPLAWDARQMKSDSSAERVQAYRERQKQAKQSGNVTVTAQDTDTDKEEETEKEEDKKKATRKRAEHTFELPDWIPADAWAAFMETRKTKKAKSTAYALGLIVKSLEAFKADGHDPLAILNASIKAGWSDVYPPKVPASAMTPARRTPAPENFASRTYTGGKL